jgi:hypothetical protein
MINDIILSYARSVWIVMVTVFVFGIVIQVKITLDQASGRLCGPAQTDRPGLDRVRCVCALFSLVTLRHAAAAGGGPSCTE